MFIKIENKPGILFDLEFIAQTNANINDYIVSANKTESINNLYHSFIIEFAIPIDFDDIKSDIMNQLSLGQEYHIYSFSDINKTQNQNLEMIGVIKEVDIFSSDKDSLIKVNFWDITCKLSETYLPDKYTINNDNYKTWFIKLLNDNGLSEFLSNVIYPKKQTLSKQDGDIVADASQTVYDFIESALSIVQAKLTTIYQNNKMYLCHVDSSNFLDNINLSNTTNELLLIRSKGGDNGNIQESSIFVKNTNLHKNFNITTKQNFFNQTRQNAKKINVENILQNQKLDKFLKNSLPSPISISTRSQLNDYDMQEYAKFLFINQLMDSCLISVLVPFKYTDIQNKKTPLTLGMACNIPKTTNNDNKNYFWQELAVYFTNPSAIKFHIAGLRTQYSENGVETTINIVPADFLNLAPNY